MPEAFAELVRRGFEPGLMSIGPYGRLILLSRIAR
jgi:hypothetical protein